MIEKNPVKLNDRIHLIDGFDLGVAERTGIYVIDEAELTIVETGPSPSIKYIKQGLEKLGFSLGQVKYIIVTHIHLDHAGGAGLLLEECPNAKVVVHEKGARHLAAPERLIAGAKAVYGEKFSVLFDPILPVPEERLVVKGEGDSLSISPTCTLTFLDTPGHANHHFSIYDPISNGMFTGDTVGIRYDQLIAQGIDLFLSSTSPNQFNPDAMRNAITRMIELDLDYLYFGHYGMTKKPNEAFQQVNDWLTVFMAEGEAVFAKSQGHDELAERLLKKVREHLRKQGINDTHDVYFLIEVDMQVSAMGIIDYLSKRIS